MPYANRPGNLKNPKLQKRHKPHFRPVRLAARLKSALREAGEMKAILKRGDADDLAEATLLQGIISGDVISAGISVRQKLQRENLRLRTRLANQKLRTQRAQEHLLLIAAAKETRTATTDRELHTRIREIYGLQPFTAAPQLEAHKPQKPENPHDPETLP